MRAVIQRVQKAQVMVRGEVVGSIGAGLVVLLGVAVGDTTKDAAFLAEKIVNLRIFEDDTGKLNRSLLDTGGQVLAVSQFTLLGNCQKGRRPSFVEAAPPEEAEPLYEDFVQAVRSAGVQVATGIFRTEMLVEIHNQGPVTLILESRRGNKNVH
ncbi:MAG: D-tyrosyl-tRNA(Tyr) deacylase [Firmicutes bacterium]|jgi:D-tyrosyl-tRNA(Tyr) deacylase|nr:D-tyrosyl-tRNA(Tyr) deacylase [Bacillota bacterium]